MLTRKTYILKFFLLCLSFCFIAALFSHCTHQELENKEDFFAHARFNGNYWRSFPLTSPDTAVKHIIEDIPPYLQIWACESAYYKLDEANPNWTDSAGLRLLDLYDTHFPPDSIRWLTQKLRGSIFVDRGQLDTATICLEDSYTWSLRSKNTVQTADINYELAALAWRKLNYPEALDRLLQVYDVYSTLNNVNEEGRTFAILRFIPKIYQSMGNYKDAKVWYQKLWKYTHSSVGTEFEKYQVIASAMVANNYLSLNQVDSAKIVIDLGFYYQQMYKTPDYYEASRYFVLGKIDLAQGKCDSALAHTKIAIQRNPFKENINVVSEYNKALADAYMSVNQQDSALFFYNTALITPDTAFQATIYLALSKTYLKIGNYTKAYRCEHLSRQFKDRALTVEKANEIGRIQARKDAEQQLKKMTYEQNIWQLKAIIGLLLLAIGLGTSFFFINQQRQQRRILHQEKAIIETREGVKTQALEQVETELIAKNTALEESVQLIELKNILISELETKLIHTPISDKKMDKNSSKSMEINELRNIKILTAADWQRFQEVFYDHFPNFNTRLKTHFPNLTASEIRLFLLMKIGFDSTEIASVLGISASSVYTSRYRLRKKMGLSEEEDLEKFIQGF